MTLNKINLNSDLAEQDYKFFKKVDKPLISNINSANISCLYHGGTKDVVEKAVLDCIKNDVSIGAHISFLDKENFGRVEFKWDENFIQVILQEQINFLTKICEAQRASITHFKPHGALSSQAAKDPLLAKVMVTYIKKYYPNLIILAPAVSELAKASQKEGLQTALEVYADRTYEDDGTLTPRSISGSLITNTKLSTSHVKNMIEKQAIISRNGLEIPTYFHSICVHSDTPNSLKISYNLCKLFEYMGIEKEKLTEIF